MLRLKERIISFITMLGIKLKIIKPKGIYYMGGANILPPPLKPEEEMELLQKLETDESVKSILIERTLRLVVYISRKFENTGIDVEDLISIGTIGLIKAVNTFKLNKNIKLATYASRCIENEILMYLRKNNKKKTMELRFGLIDKGIEKTQKEVAGMLGISQSYISRLEKKIISRLQKEMKKFV